MNRVKLHFTTFLLACVLALLVGFSAMMCLAEAFSLECTAWKLLAAAAAASLAAACAMLPGRVWLSALISAGIWLGLGAWLRQPLQESLLAVLYGITVEYADCYPAVAVLGQAGDSLLFLSMLVVPFCWITAWIICREGNALFLVLLCGPVLLLCLIIVSIAPVFWLVLLTFALLLLLLTHSVRERSAKEGSRLAWWMVLPAVILVAAITILWPPADYERAEWSTRLQETAEQGFSLQELQELPQTITASLPRWDRGLETVELSRLGPKAMTGQPVLESRMDQNRYYLRGVSLGVYEDNAWHAMDQQAYPAQTFAVEPLLAAQGSETGTLEIRTLRRERQIFTTYQPSSLPETAVLMEDAYVKNAGALQEYTVGYGQLSFGTMDSIYDDYVNQHYTRMPDALRRELEAFLESSGWDQAAGPEDLAALVRSSAVYDLNTPAIPYGEEFVLYFLQESHRGYCVHFATATVMLLRAMDIPARYVTGYSVSGASGQWVTVTEDDAHAWVEYYVNGTGWLPLEPTPSADPAAPVPETGGGTSAETEPDTETTRPEPQPPQSEPEQEPQEAAPVPQTVSGGRHRWFGLLLLPGLAALLILRRWLTVRRRKDRCARGNPNRRALAMWRWLVQLSKQTRMMPEAELVALAQKARFSQHTLTEEELQQLQQALEQRLACLKQQPVRKRLWYRYGRNLF